MPLALITHQDCSKHYMGTDHLESPSRLGAISQAITEDPSLAQLHQHAAQKASMQDLLRVHSQHHIDRIFDHVPASTSHGEQIIPLDEDTSLSSKSGEAALRAAGALVQAADIVMGKKTNRIMALVRPPGHHAEPDLAMGFCLFNSIAICASYLEHQYNIARICVIDFDVHHGNGTQAACWNTRNRLFISSHQMPLYPGSGDPQECGISNNILNIPLMPTSDGVLMRQQYEQVILPKIDAFKPEILLLSAGFDAHEDDPLANLNWSANDFFWLGKQFSAISNQHCDGKIIATLEGGYNLRALGKSTAQFLHSIND